VVIESARPPSRFGSRARRSDPGAGTRRRRPLKVISGLLVVIAVIAVIGWFEVLPRHRPALRAGERYGIDVSNHQGTIDWEQVADDDVSLVYMKATEGDDFVDKQFQQNWAGAASAGLARGAYHFFTLCSSGAAQAVNFLRMLPTDPDALAPAVDLEYSGCAERPDNATFQRELRIFVDAVESKVGKQVMLYAIPSFTKRYPLDPDLLTRDRWVRHLFRRPPTDGWAIWQVSDRGRVKGIDEPTDIDVWAPEDAA
jgi:lysozyme